MVMEIPKAWRQILEKIQMEHPHAVLAGGALRDLDHGVKVKDLDIFIACGDDEEAAGLNELLGGKEVEQPELQWYPESMREVVLVSDYDHKVNKLEVDIDIPVQFIMCNWRVDKILSRFDYAICRIGYDGRKIFYEDDYDKDKAEKTMTLVRCKGQAALEASVERFARWRPKYPKHRWVLGCALNFGTETVDTPHL